MTWAAERIGQTPENCWMFVKIIYNEELGIELPSFSHVMVKNIGEIVRTMETATSEEKGWVKVEDPKEFAVVAMSKSNFIHHVGIWTLQDKGKVLHAFEGNPVIANDILQLRRAGFKRIEFYELSPASHYLESV